MPQGGATRADALALAAALEAHSEHPLARRVARRGAPAARCRRSATLRRRPGARRRGHGRRARAAARAGRIGRRAVAGTPLPPAAARVDADGDARRAGRRRGLRALFVLGDTLRPGAAELVARLRGARHRAGAAVRRPRGDRRAPSPARSASPTRAATRCRRTSGRRSRALQAERRGRRDGRRRHQRRAVARAGAGLGEPGQRDAARAVDGRRRRALRRAAADRRRDRPRAAHVRVVRQNLAWAFVYNAIAIPGRGVRFRDAARRGARHVAVVARSSSATRCASARMPGRRRGAAPAAPRHPADAHDLRRRDAADGHPAAADSAVGRAGAARSAPGSGGRSAADSSTISTARRTGSSPTTTRAT